MLYLWCSGHLALALDADSNHVVKRWVDAAFGVSNGMKSHSGVVMSLGKVMVCSSSIRQKINTSSSTEAELIKTSGFLPQILRSRYFFEALRYIVKENILHLYNKCAVLLEKSGKASSGHSTRHISINFFFITDRIAAGELRVEHCSASEIQ